MKTKDIIISMIRSSGDYFQCPNCNYSERRRVLGDTAYSPCPNCGYSPLYRIK